MLGGGLSQHRSQICLMGNNAGGGLSQHRSQIPATRKCERQLLRALPLTDPRATAKQLHTYDSDGLQRGGTAEGIGRAKVRAYGSQVKVKHFD